MSRHLSLYLNDILESIERIQKYAFKISYEQLIDDEKTFDVIVHNLMVIGEAVKQIPDELREKYSQIPWREIAGMRDIITHAYFTINSRIVWNVIHLELVPLKACIESIQNKEI
jgi:uncharacterized protein with HEPN domain